MKPAVMAFALLAAALPAQGQGLLDPTDPGQIASGVSLGGGVHLWGSVIEVGQEVLSGDYSLSFEGFYSRSDRSSGSDRTRSDIAGVDFMLRFYGFPSEWLGIYAGGGILAGLDYWRRRDVHGPEVDHGLSGGMGLMLTVGFKITVAWNMYLDVFVKAGIAAGLEQGGVWAAAPAGYFGIKIGFWAPAGAREE